MHDPLIPRVPDDWIVWAFSDPHGMAIGFEAALVRAGLLDDELRWVAPRRTALVGCGDYLDRGPDSPRVVALLRRLELEAVAAGSRALFARGNHEHLLHQLRTGASDDIDDWLEYGGGATLEAYGCAALGETLVLEADHRRHAEIENAIRDVKYWVGLNHLPSGKFAATGAWLAVQILAHCDARWARIGLGEGIVTTKTLRRRPFSLAGRLTRSARRCTLHLPAHKALGDRRQRRPRDSVRSRSWPDRSLTAQPLRGSLKLRSNRLRPIGGSRLIRSVLLRRPGYSARMRSSLEPA